jgi:hypothetical protein
MIFGDEVEAGPSGAPGEWLDGACSGEPWTVGALVPNHHESLLRVGAPDPGLDDWWAAYQALFEVIASIGERHTASPERAWFAIWEGHGYDNVGTRVGWSDPPADEAEERARDAERAGLREADSRRNAEIRTALSRIPRIERPDRTYYLVKGPVRAVSGLHYPDRDDWRHPDLFWPDDRKWFVATDVDFWSLYIGGSSGFIDQIVASAPTDCEPVELDRLLVIED